jgi:uncharacterized membrane protein (UPF0127 family)
LTPRHVEVRNRTRDGVLLGDRIRVADRWWPRLRGLLGHPAPGEGEGLLLTPCRGVHMVGMRYALDVVLADARGRVVACFQELSPGRTTGMLRGARHALEVPVGTIGRTGTVPGDELTWTP